MDTDCQIDCCSHLTRLITGKEPLTLADNETVLEPVEERNPIIKLWSGWPSSLGDTKATVIH